MLRFQLPDGVRVLHDGSWQVGSLPVRHGASLRRMKQQLCLDDDGRPFLVDGAARVPVLLEGPPLEVLELRVDDLRGSVKLRLDDDSEELLADEALSMDETTGRFECRVRAGCFSAILSRGAHQHLLDHAEQEDGHFYLRAGLRRYAIRI